MSEGLSDAALRWAAQVQRDGVLTGKGKGSTLSVLLELCDCHNGKSGQCNPHLATLMESTHLSRASLYRALAVLRGAVGLSTTRLPNGTTQYNLPITDWTPTAPPPAATVEKKRKRVSGRELTRFILDVPPPVDRDENWKQTADSELARTRKIMGNGRR